MTDKPKQIRHWTTEEDNALREYYSRPRLIDIAKKLGRSEGSLYMRAFAMGLTRKQQARLKRKKGL